MFPIPKFVIDQVLRLGFYIQLTACMLVLTATVAEGMIQIIGPATNETLANWQLNEWTIKELTLLSKKGDRYLLIRVPSAVDLESLSLYLPLSKLPASGSVDLSPLVTEGFPFNRRFDTYVVNRTHLLRQIGSRPTSVCRIVRSCVALPLAIASLGPGFVALAATFYVAPRTQEIIANWAIKPIFVQLGWRGIVMPLSMAIRNFGKEKKLRDVLKFSGSTNHLSSSTIDNDPLLDRMMRQNVEHLTEYGRQGAAIKL